MVVMSIETYERPQVDREVSQKLVAAEVEAKVTDKRLTHDEVFTELRQALLKKLMRGIDYGEI